MQLVYLTFITPVVYDFYNYDIEKPEFVQLFVKFTQACLLSFSLSSLLDYKIELAEWIIPLFVAWCRTWPCSARCSFSWGWRIQFLEGKARRKAQKQRQSKCNKARSRHFQPVWTHAWDHILLMFVKLQIRKSSIAEAGEVLLESTIYFFVFPGLVAPSFIIKLQYLLFSDGSYGNWQFNLSYWF